MSRDQLVRINPPTELKFQGPFTETKTVVLTLENIKDAPVCFKVKTTAPKQYCVRPNSGVVEPHSSAGVQIMLQPFDYSSAKVSKHKFMVQTMYKPQNYVDSESVWKDCEPADVIDAKLKCTFEMPVASQNNLSATSSAATESVTKASSAVITEQPQSSSPIASLTTPGTTFYSIDPPNVREEDQENKEDSQQEAPASEVSTADFDEVVRERSALQKRVSELQSKTAELESQNIRQRKQISDSRKSETTPQLKPSAEIAVDNNGIPVIVFVLIALIVGLVVGKLLF